MAATIIDGKAYAEKITADLKAEIEAFTQTGGTVHLVAVQVGENAASRIYIRNQKASCEAAAINYTLLELPAETSQADLEAKIKDLNAATVEAADRLIEGTARSMGLEVVD